MIRKGVKWNEEGERCRPFTFMGRTMIFSVFSFWRDLDNYLYLAQNLRVGVQTLSAENRTRWGSMWRDVNENRDEGEGERGWNMTIEERGQVEGCGGSSYQSRYYYRVRD